MIHPGGYYMRLFITNDVWGGAVADFDAVCTTKCGVSTYSYIIPRVFALWAKQVGSMQEEMDKLKSLKIKDIKAELDVSC